MVIEGYTKYNVYYIWNYTLINHKDIWCLNIDDTSDCITSISKIF